MLGLLLLGAGAGAGCRVERGATAVATIPYDHRVGRQLIETPAASRQLLAAVPPPAPAPPAPGLAPKGQFEAEEAREWAAVVLKKPYLPPAEVPFLPIPQEEGVCDVVRARYRAGQAEVEIAQTKYLLSIRLIGFAAGAVAGDAALAARAARAALNEEGRITFDNSTAVGGRTWGRQGVPPQGPVDPEWPHWLDQLAWWCEGTDVGFITLKATGGPTKEVISAAEEDNRHWFD